MDCIFPFISRPDNENNISEWEHVWLNETINWFCTITTCPGKDRAWPRASRPIYHPILWQKVSKCGVSMNLPRHRNDLMNNHIREAIVNLGCHAKLKCKLEKVQVVICKRSLIAVVMSRLQPHIVAPLANAPPNHLNM